MPPASPEPGAAPLLPATLPAPADQALAPRRHMRQALAAVLCLPLGLLALAGCLTSALQCPSSGALLYPACENAGDGNDGAPLGVALLACWPGWSRADRQGAVPALAGTVRDAARQENPWSPHGAAIEPAGRRPGARRLLRLDPPGHRRCRPSRQGRGPAPSARPCTRQVLAPAAPLLASCAAANVGFAITRARPGTRRLPCGP